MYKLIILSTSIIFASKTLMASESKCDHEPNQKKLLYINGMNVEKKTADNQLKKLNKNFSKKERIVLYYNSNGNINNSVSWKTGEKELITTTEMLTSKRFLNQLTRASSILYDHQILKVETNDKVLKNIGNRIQPVLSKEDSLNSIFIGHSMGSLISDVFVRHNEEKEIGKSYGVYFGSQVKRNSNYTDVFNDKKDSIASLNLLNTESKSQCHDFGNYMVYSNGNRPEKYAVCSGNHKDKIIAKIKERLAEKVSTQSDLLKMDAKLRKEILYKKALTETIINTVTNPNLERLLLFSDAIHSNNFIKKQSYKIDTIDERLAYEAAGLKIASYSPGYKAIKWTYNFLGFKKHREEFERIDNIENYYKRIKTDECDPQKVLTKNKEGLLIVDYIKNKRFYRVTEDWLSKIKYPKF